MNQIKTGIKKMHQTKNNTDVDQRSIY